MGNTAQHSANYVSNGCKSRTSAGVILSPYCHIFGFQKKHFGSVYFPLNVHDIDQMQILIAILPGDFFFFFGHCLGMN